MTLQALPDKIGEAKMTELLKTWTAEHRHGNATSARFVATAERVSGQDLEHCFDVWIYSPGKPTDW